MMIESVWQDVTTGVRFLRRNPVFTVIAVVTLALGIGANTAMFSATYAVVLKPLPYPRAAQLVELRAIRSKPTLQTVRVFSIPALEDISSQSRSLTQVGYASPAAFVLTGDREPESLRGLEVSGSYFSVYDVPAFLGRAILPTDTKPDAPLVAVLSYGLWQRAFGGRAEIIGTTIRLASQPITMFSPQSPPARPYVVVGIMPPVQRFPVDAQLWTTLKEGAQRAAMNVSPRAIRNIGAVARLRDGATLEQSQQELHLLASRLATENPATDADWDMTCVPLRAALSESHRVALYLLLGAVSFVLLLACVTVSSLLVSRNRARQADVAMRETLGASRRRLMQQLLIESVLLAVLGGALGLALASWSLGSLRALAPATTPGLADIQLNLPVLGYTLVMSLIAGVLFGLAPAIRLTTPQLATALKADVRPVATFPLPFRPQGLMIGLQIAITFPLLVGSLLALRSFDRLIHVDLGFQRERILTVSLKLSSARCAKFEACANALSDIVSRVRDLGGVEGVAVAGSRPLSMPLTLPITVEGETQTGRPGALSAQYQLVTAEYFRTMGIQVTEGRAFTDLDDADAPRVAIVNHALARQRFAGAALGKRLNLRPGDPTASYEVVGEVNDTRDVNPTRSPLPTFYVPFAQSRLVPRIVLLVRTTNEPSAMTALIRQQVRAVDPDAPITEVMTMREIMAEAVSQQQFQAFLLSIFAALGLGLTLLGIYGLISYATTRRLREFGVRLALGAKPSDIVKLILREALPAVGGGIVLGAICALSLTQALRYVVFELSPTEPATYVGVALLMAFVSVLAYYIPARRAGQVDPMRVLREE